MDAGKGKHAASLLHGTAQIAFCVRKSDNTGPNIQQSVNWEKK